MRARVFMRMSKLEVAHENTRFLWAWAKPKKHSLPRGEKNMTHIKYWRKDDILNSLCVNS